MQTFSQGTDTWKQVTRDITISAYNPVAARTETAGDEQTTKQGLEIPVPSEREFLGDLNKATRRQTSKS